MWVQPGGRAALATTGPSITMDRSKMMMSAPSYRRLRRVARHLILPVGGGRPPCRPPVMLPYVLASSSSEFVPVADLAKSTRGAEEVDEEEAEIRRYMAEGVARAKELGNRGPWRLDPDGRLAQEIVDAYHRCGFYVFEDLLSMEEILDLRKDFEAFRANAPTEPNSKVDKLGRPVLHPEAHRLERPLRDRVGGTKQAVYNWSGTPIELDRHQLKMREPPKPADAPEWVHTMMIHPLAHMDANLRVYGHPKLLKVAERINGPDFTPFTESVWIKPARVGTPTAWHQDVSGAYDHAGWGEPGSGFDPHTGGFSFHVTLYDCTPENGLWVVPGSNNQGRVDQKALSLEGGGSDRLPSAVPVIAKPRDVYMQSRQVLHGSFANTSEQERVTLQFGFHQRKDVLGIKTLGYTGPDGKNPSFMSSGAWKVYDDAYIRKRSKMIPLAIDCRRQRYGDEETPYVYQPTIGEEEQYRWSPKLKEDNYGKYWETDLII